MRYAALFSLLIASQACGGIIASTLYFECRGEPFEGQIAVASVIYNRSQRSGRSLEAVCLKRKQFSCWNRGLKTPKPRNSEERDLLKRFLIIERDMERGTFKPTSRATHYYNHKLCTPSWNLALKERFVVGNHTFGVTN